MKNYWQSEKCVDDGEQKYKIVTIKRLELMHYSNQCSE